MCTTNDQASHLISFIHQVIFINYQLPFINFNCNFFIIKIASITELFILIIVSARFIKVIFDNQRFNSKVGNVKIII
jgi:hypothetical protein